MFFATYLASIITHYEPIYKSLGVLVFLLVEVAFVGCVAIGFLQSGSGSDLSLPAFLLPGLFVTVAFAEIWSLFGGLVPRANPALILVAVIVAALRRRTFAKSVREGIRNTRWRSLILFVPCAFFAALNALTNGYCYDNLLYHLAAVRWVADFGSVPGLANLHGRLGFNSALHPLAAFFGAPFGIAIGSEFVNPVIVLCVCAVLVQGIRLKPKEFFTPDSVYAALFLPLILYLAFARDHFRPRGRCRKRAGRVPSLPDGRFLGGNAQTLLCDVWASRRWSCNLDCSLSTAPAYIDLAAGVGSISPLDTMGLLWLYDERIPVLSNGCRSHPI